MEPDPKYPRTITKGLQVKYAQHTTDLPAKWLDGIVEYVFGNQSDHVEDGAKCRFKTSRIGFVKEIVKSFELTEIQVDELITSSEGKEIERKESFLVDVKTNTVKEWVKDQVVKEVAAFMNSNGGHIVIGQSDNGDIVGLERDLQYIENTKRLEKDNVDDYKTKMEDYINKKLVDKRLFGLVNILVPKFLVGGKTICILKIDKSHKIPALLNLEHIQIINTKMDNHKEKDLFGQTPAPSPEIEQKGLECPSCKSESIQCPVCKSDKEKAKSERKWQNTNLKPVIFYKRLNQKTVEHDLRDFFTT